MNAVRIYAVGVLVSIALSALFFAPFLGLPIGTAISTGGSMGDDGATVNFYVDGEPAIGDVVIYDSGSDWGLHEHGAHRVIDETDAGYVTKGDANDFVDQETGAPYATDERTLGVVVARVSVGQLFVSLSVVTALVGGVSVAKNRNGASSA